MSVSRHEIMVPMRDGVRLATDIYVPEGADLDTCTPRPVILERTPYGKRQLYRTERTREDETPMPREDIAAWFTRHGYIVVYQDCRGRFASEGDFTKYLGEGPDGYDTMAWLVAQPFCNGRIGTMGLSYAAHTQSAAACLDPPGLRCMLLDSGGFSNAFQGGIRQGGALELKQATWAIKHARLSRTAQDNPDIAAALDAEDIHAWFKPERMPWKRGESPIRWVPEYEDYLFQQWEHAEFDDYWKQVGLFAAGYYREYANVPMLHMSSWYDAYARTATENFTGLASHGKGPLQLVLGPWLHGHRSDTFSGDVDFGSQATLDDNLAANYLEFRRLWFDRWLMEVDNEVADQAAVRYFLMGGGSGRRNPEGRLEHGGGWCEAGEWPPAGVRHIPYFLGDDGHLHARARPQGAPSLSFIHDPLDPVPSVGGTVTSGAPIMEGGGFDQTILDSRKDILMFVSDPLEEDMELTGSLVAELWVASDAVDTDITVKLIDWYPPSDDYPRGYALNITDGILRLRYRDSWEHPSMLTPGEPVKIRVEPFPSSNLFKTGHRIRIDIASSKYPHFDLNPLMQKSRNTILMDADHPSRVLLPVRCR